MDIGVGTQHAASLIALDESQFGQHLDILMVLPPVQIRRYSLARWRF